MPELDEAQLKKQIASDVLSDVYLIAGEEKYLVKRTAGRLRKKAETVAFPEFNFNEFSDDSAIDDVADAVLSLPLFSDRKFVFVSDWDIDSKDAAEQDKLFELLDDSFEGTTLVFYYPTLDTESKKSAKWKKLVKTAQSKGGVIFCERRTAPELEKMLVREAEKAGCVISRQNAGKILEYAGQDVARLLGEIEKLCSYALGSGETRPAEITPAMIEEIVPKTTETTVFLLANALVAGDYDKAYSLLDMLFYQKEEPVAILAALSSSYVDMYRVRVALDSYGHSSKAAEFGEYKGREFRLRNAERSLRHLDGEALRESLYLLLDADMSLKGSKTDEKIILEELIAKLLLAARGEKA